MAEEQSDYNILDEYIRACGINIVGNTWQMLESSAKIYGYYYNATIKREEMTEEQLQFDLKFDDEQEDE